MLWESTWTPVEEVTADAEESVGSREDVPAELETIRRRRRSTMSASAPAGRPNRKKGRLSAVSSKDTMRGEGVSDDINQP